MPVSEKAYRDLSDALDQGRWKPGERLPPERDLSRQLNIGRSSLRKALSQLEEEGRIWRHVGQGTFVTKPLDADMPGFLHLGHAPSPADVLELRLMIEPPIAAAVAHRGAAADIRRIGQHVLTASAARSWESWEMADTAFHLELARASHNPLLIGVMEGICAIRSRDEWSLRRTETLTTSLIAEYCEEHRRLFEAIAGRNPSEAAHAMRRHLGSVQTALMGKPAETPPLMRSEPVAAK